MNTTNTLIEEKCKELARFIDTNWQDMQGGDLVDVDPVAWLRDAFTSLLAEQQASIIELITTHTEHEGGYCDTGADMHWKCRSDCMELALKRLRYHQPVSE